MSRLLKLEFYKIKAKKSLKVIIICSFFFLLLTNFYALSQNKEHDYLKSAKDNLALLDKNNAEDVAKINLNEYMLQKKRDLNVNNANKMLELFFDNYWIIILVVCIMLSASALGDEYNDDTMKNLLIKPYKRSQILTAKYLSYFVTVIFFILVLLIMQLLIGGLIFHFDNLKLPIVIYNFKLKKIVEYSIGKYLFLKFLLLLPELILIYTLTFLSSILIKNSSKVNILMYVLIILFELINTYVAQFHFSFLKIILTANWDFGYLLTGQKAQYTFVTPISAIIICIIYLIILLIFCYNIFNKSDLKNIK